MSHLKPSPPIPGTLPPASKLAEAIAGPISSFLRIQAASGILLLVVSLVALVWANSRWHASYEHLWHIPITIGAGGFLFSKPLHFWINDGLMVVFFFVVGLEIRRELHDGELSEAKRAALPAIAALGGMAVPGLIYFAFNRAAPGERGWGVPMATDIAFAVGALALLGKRVPAAIRVLLLALAVIDDIGAIVVIALFYSSQFSWAGLAITALGVLGVLAFQSIGVRRPGAYVLPGIVAWVGFLKAGIHPTIAGVALGLLTPVKPWYGVRGFVATARSALERLGPRSNARPDPHVVTEVLDHVGEAGREAVSPVVRLQAALHPWVAFVIMPLFAFANAGVRVTDVDLGTAGSAAIATGVIMGLCTGKPIGVFLATFLAVKAGIAARPQGVTWRGIALVGLVAGIGFTMAIFTASLAFPDPRMLSTAKLSVLAASALAGVGALVGGRLLLPAVPVGEMALTPEEAEASTDK